MSIFKRKGKWFYGKKLLTIKEVAKMLNYPTSKIYQLARSKGFPALKLGKEWRVDGTKLDKWIEKQIQVKDSECLMTYSL